MNKLLIATFLVTLFTNSSVMVEEKNTNPEAEWLYLFYGE